MRAPIVTFVIVVSLSLLMVKVGGEQERETVDVINPELVEQVGEAAPLGSVVYQANAVSPIYDSKIYCPAEFNSYSVIAKHIDENFNLIEKKPVNRWPIASLTKLMTAVVTLEKIGPEKTILVSENAVNSEGAAGNLRPGETYIAFDLIKAMLLTSSNDAAFALAEAYGVKNFVREMNKKAGELGMLQTSFFEPTGLSFLNQSTANDLAKLVSYIYTNYPEIFGISRQKEGWIMNLETNQAKRLINTNQFAGQPDFLGGKSGFIDESQQNLISLFNNGGRPILMIVLGSQDKYKETKKLKSLIQNCQRQSQQ